eukprot:8901110-Pyramimonas_sp.AAC.1
MYIGFAIVSQSIKNTCNVLSLDSLDYSCDPVGVPLGPSGAILGPPGDLRAPPRRMGRGADGFRAGREAGGSRVDRKRRAGPPALLFLSAIAG